MSTKKRVGETTGAENDDYLNSKKLKLESANANSVANSNNIPVSDINNALENAKKHGQISVQESEKADQDANNEEENAIDPVLNEHKGSGQNQQRKLFNNSDEEKEGKDEEEELEEGGEKEDDKNAESREHMESIQITTNESNSKSSTDPSVLLKLKKMNHKEVERRRRETINNAIKELQDLVPTTHTNKAQIIRKASEYIKKLKEKEENLVNKWTLEKIITDQAISELATSNEKLKSELEKAYRENERFKHIIKGLITEVKKQSNNSDSTKDIINQTEELFTEIDDSNEKEEEDEEEEDEEEEVEANVEQTPDENIDDKLKSSEQEPGTGSDDQ
ncbi:hypothetical protein CANINC_001379 [Pichia inconspicua]|uniref:BHLH domain-containing protein n=1 Tax=Pichia inconspicua TaxID=52247 RepID=A0A4V4NFZ8_9ASCO|nr:hypothetical protein CANINC_001379 [[Candida] inconspicua]